MNHTTDLKTATEAIANLEYTRTSCWRVQCNPEGVTYTSEETGAVFELNKEPEWAEEFQERLEFYTARLSLPLADIEAIASYPWVITLDAVGEDLIDTPPLRKQQTSPNEPSL